MVSLTSGNMSPAEVDLLWRTDRPQIGADRYRLARRGNGFHLPVAMIRGRIAIPDIDPKTWRSRGRKKKRTQPAMASAIVTPAPMRSGGYLSQSNRCQLAAMRSSRGNRRSSSRRRAEPTYSATCPTMTRRHTGALARRPTNCSARSCGALPSVTDDLPTARNTLPNAALPVHAYAPRTRQQRAGEGLAFLPAALLDGIAPHQVLSASPGLEGKRDKQQPPDRFRAVRLVKLTVAPFVQVL